MPSLFTTGHDPVPLLAIHRRPGDGPKKEPKGDQKEPKRDPKTFKWFMMVFRRVPDGPQRSEKTCVFLGNALA